jgi:hypothetical protein
LGVSEKKLGLVEHVGPLRVERYEKQDGRRLILYSLERAQSPEELDEDPPRG